MSGDVFSFVMMGGWVVGGRGGLLLASNGWEAGNAGKHATMHGAALLFQFVFIFYLLVKESAVFVFWPYK